MKARFSQLRSYLRKKVFSAREAIYNLGIPVKGAAVERLLKDHSLVPTLVSTGLLSRKAGFIHYILIERIHGVAVTIGLRTFPNNCC
jgi:hypothetical protein